MMKKLKPHIRKLPFEDTPWTCCVKGELTTLCGFGMTPKQAYYDLLSELEYEEEFSDGFAIYDILLYFAYPKED